LSASALGVTGPTKGSFQGSEAAGARGCTVIKI